MSGPRSVVSADGTTIGWTSVGSGPPVLVIPGVLSRAADYAAFAAALGTAFTVHTIERRGRGTSGPQGGDYGIGKEIEDVRAVLAATGASMLVGHSYGGLIALEVARGTEDMTKVAVYEPGVSIDRSMPTHWMPGYERKLAGNKRVDALVEFTLADAPPPINRIPPVLMKLIVRMLLTFSPAYRPMLDLLEQNLLEWKEIARLDSTYENYREIGGQVLLMYGGKSRSRAVDLLAERLPAVVPHCETLEFPGLDHFGIERTAPERVAEAVGAFFAR